MSTSPHSREQRALGKILRGPRAVSALPRLVVPAAPELVLDGSSLKVVDAYGGVVIRTAIEAHLSRGASHSVSIVEPRDESTWRMLFDLVGGLSLPLRCSWAGTRSAATRGSDVLVPATPIVDNEDVTLLVDHTVRVAAGALGYGDRPGRFLQEAAAVLLDNAREHGSADVFPAIVCASLEPQGNDLQLVTANLADRWPDPAVGDEALRQAVGPSSSHAEGALTQLVALRRGGLEVSVRLAWGTGRARYRTADSWRFTTSPDDVPGFVAGVEVHR
jgi:hypothetical protein